MGTTGQSITLANSIIGVGILAMPFCFQQCGVLLATIILLSMGLVSRLCCYFLLKSALLSRRRNFEFLAFHVFGSVGKLAVEVGIIGFLMGTCIAYFVVVGDLGPQIISKMFNINQSDILRTSIMVIVSLVCVLPLGLLRNVDSLSNVSAATICFYICLVMKVIAEAASQLLTGDWQARVEMWRPAGVLQCVPIFSMALFCQTQLFEIFESLPTLSLEKMNLVTKNAINICTGVYFTLGLFGYIAFSAQDISGNILMSLSPTMASDVIKLGFVMSVAFSFPLIIFPCRASLYSLLYKKVHSSQHDHLVAHAMPARSFRVLTVGIVAGALAAGLLLPNIELVLGLLGATIGVLVCVVFPAAAFVHVTVKNTNERLLAKGILILGLIIMVLGTYANLQAAESQIEKYDEKYITQERIDKIVEDFFQKREKADNVVAKPQIAVDKHEEADNKNKESFKESVILPPNPVPPESDEKAKNNGVENKSEKPRKKLVKLDNEIVDKVSETHPRNLNKLNDMKSTNGANRPKNIENPKEEIKPQSLEEKINMRKQQQLIETIKQHGEEQKELIKEQKEILTEIKKTKEELQKSKNEAAEVDAKKIAVENIKKIANMAIQSLASVSDKPGQLADEKVDNLEKIADEAVQEIALKAVETIEAIKEIKEKPQKAQASAPVPPVPQLNVLNTAQNNIEQANVPQPNNNIASNAQNNQVNVNSQVPQNNINVQPQQKSLVNSQPAPNVASNVESVNVAQPAQNVAQPSQNVHQSASNGAQPIQSIPIAVPAVQPIENIQQVPSNAQPANPPVANQIVQNPPSNNIANQPPVVQKLANQNVQKQHAHSQDEPQSYKRGEDAQKNLDQALNILAQNVPLAVNNNSLNNQNVQNNGAHKVENVVRRKREVVDCTAKSTLKPEDKEICKTLIDKPGLNTEVKDILASNVDLSHVAMPKDIAMQGNVLHHISRSLKMIDERNKGRR